MISENIRRLKMGGYGSGRPASKRKAEGCRTLNVNRLNREGCLRPAWPGTWQWSRYGKQVASIGCKATETSFVLNYRIQLNGDDWEPITQPIPNHPHRLSLRQSAALFSLPRRDERAALRATCRQAVLRPQIFPMSPLLQPRLYQPVRGQV